MSELYGSRKYCVTTLQQVEEDSEQSKGKEKMDKRTQQETKGERERSKGI